MLVNPAASIRARIVFMVSMPLPVPAFILVILAPQPARLELGGKVLSSQGKGMDGTISGVDGLNLLIDSLLLRLKTSRPMTLVLKATKELQGYRIRMFSTRVLSVRLGTWENNCGS